MQMILLPENSPVVAINPGDLWMAGELILKMRHTSVKGFLISQRTRTI